MLNRFSVSFDHQPIINLLQKQIMFVYKYYIQINDNNTANLIYFFFFKIPLSVIKISMYSLICIVFRYLKWSLDDDKIFL